MQQPWAQDAVGLWLQEIERDLLDQSASMGNVLPNGLISK
jgi:hypothetical protein